MKGLVLLVILLAGLVFSSTAGAQGRSWYYQPRRGDCHGRQYNDRYDYDGRRGWYLGGGYPGGYPRRGYGGSYGRGYAYGYSQYPCYGNECAGILSAPSIVDSIVGAVTGIVASTQLNNTARQAMNTNVAEQALGQGYSDFDMNASAGHIGYRAGSSGQAQQPAPGRIESYNKQPAPPAPIQEAYTEEQPSSPRLGENTRAQLQDFLDGQGKVLERGDRDTLERLIRGSAPTHGDLLHIAAIIDVAGSSPYDQQHALRQAQAYVQRVVNG